MGSRPHVRCEKCGSLERTRIMKLVLDRIQMPKFGMKVLHLAPERALATYFVEKAGGTKNYHAFDLNPSLYKWAPGIKKLDLCTEVESLKENYYDLVVHSHVMEHLPCNYAYVLFHLHRSLKETGYHICCIPVMSGFYDETTASIPTEEAIRRFGQHDHVRRFGVEDIQFSLGTIFRLKREYDLEQTFSQSELIRYNIPQSSWKGYSPDSIMVFRKDDIKMKSRQSRAADWLTSLKRSLSQ